MNALRVWIMLVGFISVMALSGCSGDLFGGGGLGSGDSSTAKPACNPNGTTYCQDDPLSPRGTRH